MKVLTLGEILLRLATPGYERLFQRNKFEWSFCGAEVNVAVALSNMGISSKFVTKIPNNEIGNAVIKNLDYHGVDTSNIIRGNGRLGLYFLEKGVSQRASKVIYDRKNSTFAESKLQEYDWDKIFKDITWFHFSGINPALSLNVRKLLLDACAEAKKRNIIVSCDLNYRHKLWSTDEAKKTMMEIMNYVDVCIGNEEDAKLALGFDFNEFTIENYKKTANLICNTYNCKSVAFTLRESYSASHNGWSGILYKDGILYQSQKYEIQIVDRVGSGDSFAAGIIYGFLKNYKPEYTLEYAVAASCLKHTIEGDFDIITPEEINLLIENGGNGRIQR